MAELLLHLAGKADAPGPKGFESMTEPGTLCTHVQQDGPQLGPQAQRAIPTQQLEDKIQILFMSL